jgi:hypothetical protein
LPAWYLPRGTTNATETQLENALLSCEWWAIGFGVLVVVSIMAEFLIAWIKPPFNIFLETSAFTDAGVALGIVGEVVFGMWNNRIQTELRNRSNKRGEEAITRAAILEKEAANARERVALIEQLTSWRHISPEETEQIAEGLSVLLYEIDLLIEYQNLDAESWSYSVELANVFGKAGIAKIRHRANFHVGFITFGVLVRGASGENAVRIVREFTKVGIPMHATDKDMADLSMRVPRNEVVPNLYVFVGSKPPALLGGWDIATAADRADPPQSANEAFQQASEVEKRTAERRLTAEQARTIAKGMKGHATVWMTHAESDLEAFSFASDIRQALETSGASVTLWPASFSGHVVTGLWLTPREGDSDEAERLMKALVAAGISFTKSSATANAVRLHVGHKPPLESA